jgi:hypothetical protein
MLKNGFQRLLQILGDPEHHFAAGLQFAMLQLRDRLTPTRRASCALETRWACRH